jgi:FkbM family methyltransferase
VLAKMFPNAMVYSFEPNPRTRERLLRNIELNQLSRIEVHGCAVGGESGFVSLDEPEGNSGAARVIPGGRIPIITLDEFCAEHGIEDLDFVKVDIEGSEEHLLRGGSQTLRRLRPILLIELNPPVLRRMGSSVEAVVSALRDLDYDVLDVERKKLIRFAGVPDGQLSNVICIPAEKA